MSEIRRLKKIAECCEILDNFRVPINEENRQNMIGNVPYYGANGIQGYINNFIFNEELILIAEDGGNFEQFSTRPIAYKISGKSWVNNHAHILRAKSDFNQDYIFYSLVNKDILRFIKGGTRSKLNKAELEKIEIEFPISKKQEDKIASILSTADAVIEKTRAAIAKYKAIKQGMLHDLFTRGIDPATGRLRPTYEQAPELYKETKLGWVPKEWEVEELSAFTEKIGSGITPTGGDETYLSTGVLFLRSQNILRNSLTLEDVAFISNAQDEIMEGSRVKPFDLLLNITGASIGRCAFFPSELRNANVNQHVCIIRFANTTEQKSIFYSEFFNNHFGQSQIYRANAGGNREGLNFQEIKKFFIPILRNEEIELVSEKMRSFSTKIQTEQSYLQKLLKIKSGLMADLLGGRREVRV